MGYRSSPFVIALLFAACRTSAPPEPEPAPEAEMVLIRGGNFEMGAVDADTSARPCERPRHTVHVSDFLLDRTEVTVAAWAAAVAAGAVAEPTNRAETSWQADLANWGRADRQDHPINGVTWFQADAYCRWRGARLPTEAELEYALAAGADDSIWPWGSTPTPPARAGNYAGEEVPRFFAGGKPLQGYRDDHSHSAPVGSYPPNELGVFDLSGNTWEWCSDWYDETWYAHSPDRDPVGPAQGERKILKGGGFHCELEELRIAERHHKRPTDGSVFSGLRCARDAPPASGTPSP